MKVASISTIKNELHERSHQELVACCLRLAKFKRENKELLNYLLYESVDEENYKNEIKDEAMELFGEVNLNSVYFAKKTIRKILRLITRYIRYSGEKQTALELLIFFCQQFRALRLPFQESKVLLNLYDRQLININKVLNTLDEDLQFDYARDLEEIRKPLPGQG